MGILEDLLVIFMIATGVVLILGIYTMFKNKSTADSSNKFMQWRIILQAIALALLAFMFFISRK